jgi:hypothetical protein
MQGEERLREKERERERKGGKHFLFPNMHFGFCFL